MNTNPVMSDEIDDNIFKIAFTEIQSRAFENAKEKGFHNLLSQLKDNGFLLIAQKNEIKNLFVIKSLGLICEEIGEAMSAWRHHNAMDDKLTHRHGIEVEMADAVIRIMDLAGFLELDVAGAIIEKMNYNNNREYMHGKVA